MEVKNVKQRIKDVFSRTGYMIDDENRDLNEYIPDSLGFINLIIELEDEFVISFPDEILGANTFSNLDSLVCFINDLKLE